MVSITSVQADASDTEPLVRVSVNALSLTPAEAAVRCANCYAPDVGKFCAECGAPRLDSRPITVRRFMMDAWHEVTSLDSATMLTVRSLLNRPGELSEAFLAGRTRRFLPPLRVYLLTFGIYLLGQSILPDDYAIGVHAAMKKQQGISSTGPATVIRGPGTPAAKTPATPANADRARRRGRADAVLAQIVPRTADAMITATSNSWLTLLNVFPLAVALSWLYRRPRRNYAEHVVVAIHMLSANALLLLVNAYAHSAIGTPRAQIDGLLYVHWLLLGSYFFVASRRVYQESPRVTASKSVLFVASAQLTVMVLPSLVAFAVAGQVVVQAVLAARG